MKAQEGGVPGKVVSWKGIGDPKEGVHTVELGLVLPGLGSHLSV